MIGNLTIRDGTIRVHFTGRFWELGMDYHQKKYFTHAVTNQVCNSEIEGLYMDDTVMDTPGVSWILQMSDVNYQKMSTTKSNVDKLPLVILLVYSSIESLPLE